MQVLLRAFYTVIETVCSLSNEMPTLKPGYDGIADMLLCGALEVCRFGRVAPRNSLSTTPQVTYAMLMRVDLEALLYMFRSLLQSGQGGYIHKVCHAVLLLIVAQVTFDKSLLPVIGNRTLFIDILNAVPSHSFRPLMFTAGMYICNSVASSEPHVWRCLLASLPPNSPIAANPYHLAQYLLANMKSQDAQQDCTPSTS